MSTDFQIALRKWVVSQLGVSKITVSPLVAEASTRRFWRIGASNSSWVAMHSPPATENNEQFIRLSRVFSENGVPVPRVIASELDRGFLLVDDLGDCDLHSLYGRIGERQSLSLTLDPLLAIQRINHPSIPLYTSQRLSDEIDIFNEWICTDTCAISDEPLASAGKVLVDEIDDFPKVTVHRDFHSRNLLVKGDSLALGIVDFQDALRGPITYDIASLLFDCYYQHKETDIQQYIDSYLEGTDQNREYFAETLEFSNAVRATAIQRLLKAAGIFVRLWRTRGRNSHLGDVEPTLKKAINLCRTKSGFEELSEWLEEVVLPKTMRKLGQS